MMPFDPELLARWTGGRWTAPSAEPIHGFTNDTRRLAPGQAFVALQTGRRDGHHFLGAAAAAGAAAALVRRAGPPAVLPQLVVRDPLEAFQAIAREHRRRFAGPVTGISGSAGKTSTKDLLARLLGNGRAVLATEGNLNNLIGVPLTLTRLDPALHACAVIEAGISEPGEMAVLAAMIDPEHAVITLVAPAHLEKMAGLEIIADEKAVLPAARRAGGYAVFPASCLAYQAFRELPGLWLVRADEPGPLPAVAHGATVTYSIGSHGGRTKLALAFDGAADGDYPLRPMSAGMARNAVLAIALARRLGVGAEWIRRELADWQPARWRGELRRDGKRTFYLDFYNANPASMADALDSFQTMTPAAQPRLYVLGCMEELGPESADYHRRLGRTLRLRPDDRLFAIGDQADALRDGLLESGGRAGQIEIVTDPAAAAGSVAGFAGAVFLKGSRRYQLEKALEGTALVQPAGAPAAV